MPLTEPLPDPSTTPTVMLWPTAAQALGMSKNAAYRHARSGTFPVPVIRCGHKFVVATATLRRVLDLDHDS